MYNLGCPEFDLFLKMHFMYLKNDDIIRENELDQIVAHLDKVSLERIGFLCLIFLAKNTHNVMVGPIHHYAYFA